MSEYKLGAECTMSVGDITASYRQAKDKPAQIGILADLCCTSKKEIVRILCDEGCVDDSGNPPRLPGIEDEDMPDIIRMRKNGLHLDVIAKKYGVTAPTVSKKIKAYERESCGDGATEDIQTDSEESESEHSVSYSVATSKTIPETSEQRRRRRFYDSLDVDKDFYDLVLEVYKLLRYVAMMFPGVKMVCEIEGGQVMASGGFQDLLAEYQGGGDPSGKPDDQSV